MMGEDFLTDFARLLREQLQPGDLAGPFRRQRLHAAASSAARAQDVEAWAEHVVHKVATEVFQVGAKSLSTTCTIGLGPVPARSARRPRARPATPSTRIARAARLGGNRVQLLEHTGAMLRLQDADRIWVKQIKSALMENRFRLVQQPIASLVGEDLGMFDVLVRMLDEQGEEVLPSRFHAGRRTQRPDEEHRPLGRRRGDVVLRGAQARRAVRAPVAGHAVPTPRCPPGSRTS